MLLVVVVLVGAALLLAQPAARAGNPCTVPASWGRLAAVTEVSVGRMLTFEASDGTIRITSAGCGNPPKADIVHRSAD
jgi:hypothetical protein